MSTGKIKMQDVSFRNIDQFMEFLPEDELKIVQLLRKIIFNCIPEVREKLAYNVPFYKLNKNICFIWPASVLWGKKKTYEGVRLGFAKGHLMTDESGYLNKGDRKFVYWKDFNDIKEIDIDLIKSFIFEAVILDGEGKKNKTN